MDGFGLRKLTSLVILLAYLVSCVSGYEDISQPVIYDPSKCGVTKGCFWVPADCLEAGSPCNFFLTWQHYNDSVRIELLAKVSEASWAALGLNDEQEMSGTSVVDCIVNASDDNQVVIQKSHNTDHHNDVLVERHLGLVNGSLYGIYKDGHIVCAYNHLKTIDRHHTESSEVANLTSPHYVILAHGPATEDGVKKKHISDPFVSSHKISFLTYTNQTMGWRPAEVRIHVTLMVAAWILFASIGILASRYMKPPWIDVMLCGKQLWFQVHWLCMIATLLSTAVAVVMIFKLLNWQFKPPELHPLLGFIVGCLVLLNPIIALTRPDADSPRRFAFRIFHGLIGHGTHLLAVVTMFFGVQQDRAHMPEWTKWFVLSFGGWRLLADFFLSITVAASDRPSMLSVSESPANYRSIEDSEADSSRVFNWRAVIIAVYLAGALALALYLMITINSPL